MVWLFEALNAEKDAMIDGKSSLWRCTSELEKICQDLVLNRNLSSNPVDTYYTGSATARPRPDMFYTKEDLANQIVVEKDVVAERRLGS